VQAVYDDNVAGFVEGREHGGACQGRHVRDVLMEAVEGATELDQVYDIVPRFVQQLRGATHVPSLDLSEEAAKGAAPCHDSMLGVEGGVCGVGWGGRWWMMVGGGDEAGEQGECGDEAPRGRREEEEEEVADCRRAPVWCV